MSTLEQKIAEEQVRAIYKQLPAIISSAVGAIIMVYILKDSQPHGRLMAWLGTVLLNCIVAGGLYLYYLKYGRNTLHHSHWKYFIILFTFFAGIVWGVIGIIFYSSAVEIKLFIVVWIWALGAGMTSLLVAYRPAFYAMVIPLFLPLTVSLAIDNESFYQALSAATFVWMASLMYFYQAHHNTLMNAISLQFINAELMEDFAEKRREAESANLAKSQFLAAASHDLRQPLHAQSLFLAELDQYVDNPTGRRILAGLENSVYALRKLLNTILDLSRLDAGTVNPAREIFSVSSVFVHLKSEFETLAEEKGIDLRVCKCSLPIYTDPVLFERVLRNLISNAIRYTTKGKVLVGCRRHAHSVSIQVLDTGAGISEDHQNIIFLPFRQLGNPERDREKGLGLGLSIVQRTCELLDHALSLTSKQGKGTAVSVDVPLATQSPSGVHNSQPLEDFEHIKGKRILVIDDDADVCTAMLGLLTSWGCCPLVFQDINDALKNITQDSEQIDAILSDLNLAGNISGIQAIEMLRTQCGLAIPAALITGETSASQLREAKYSGLEVIHKPVLAGELRSLINKLVSQSK